MYLILLRIDRKNKDYKICKTFEDLATAQQAYQDLLLQYDPDQLDLVESAAVGVTVTVDASTQTVALEPLRIPLASETIPGMIQLTTFEQAQAGIDETEGGIPLTMRPSQVNALIEAGGAGQAVINVSVNGEPLPVIDQSVDIPVPTVDDITEDARAVVKEAFGDNVFDADVIISKTVVDGLVKEFTADNAASIETHTEDVFTFVDWIYDPEFYIFNEDDAPQIILHEGYSFYEVFPEWNSGSVQDPDTGEDISAWFSNSFTVRAPSSGYTNIEIRVLANGRIEFRHTGSELPIDSINIVDYTEHYIGRLVVGENTVLTHDDLIINGKKFSDTDKIENALTTSMTVGGIASGSTYAAGTPVETILRELLDPIQYPTFTAPSASLSVSPTGKLIECGGSQAVTFTAAFNRGTITPAYGTSGYRAGEATEYSLNGGAGQAGNTWNITVTESVLDYSANVNYSAGEQPKNSKGGDYDSPLPSGSVTSNVISYEFVNALWANTSNIATVAKLELISKSTKQKEFNFPAATVANPETFDVPASWTITAVEVQNPFNSQWEDCSSQFSITDVNHDDAGGVSTAYKRYSDNRSVSVAARKIRIKWN